jgi:hypothetical protein
MRVGLVFLLLFVIASCKPQKTHELIQGSWIRFYEGDDDFFFPYGIAFKEDSIILSDGYLFTHKIKFDLQPDSIKLNFEHEFDTTFSVNLTNDSTLLFGEYTFYKVPDSIINHFDAFSLLGIQAANELTQHSPNASFIALVKRAGDLKVQLGESFAELEWIDDFLIPYDAKPPP